MDATHGVIADEPAVPSQPRVIRKPKWDLLVWWLVATLVGGVLGQALWQVLPREGCLFFVFFVIPTFTATLFQWLVLRRYLYGITLLAWAGVTLLGEIVSNLLRNLSGFLFLT